MSSSRSKPNEEEFSSFKCPCGFSLDSYAKQPAQDVNDKIQEHLSKCSQSDKSGTFALKELFNAFDQLLNCRESAVAACNNQNMLTSHLAKILEEKAAFLAREKLAKEAELAKKKRLEEESKVVTEGAIIYEDYEEHIKKF